MPLMNFEAGPKIADALKGGLCLMWFRQPLYLLSAWRVFIKALEPILPLIGERGFDSDVLF